MNRNQVRRTGNGHIMTSQGDPGKQFQRQVSQDSFQSNNQVAYCLKVFFNN